jgi:serine/threonine protein kinase
MVIQTYVQQLLAGLQYLHENGVLHRDIKGANVLMDHGIVKLSDFGLSKIIDSESKKSFSTKGTPAWMAPEIITQQHYSCASDIWALGCTILEMVTGKIPWSEVGKKDPIHLMVHIATTNTVPQIPFARISPALGDLLTKCLERDPTKRPSAAQLLNHEFFTDYVPYSPARKPKMCKEYFLTESYSEYEGSWMIHEQITKNESISSSSSETKSNSDNEEER